MSNRRDVIEYLTTNYLRLGKIKKVSKIDSNYNSNNYLIKSSNGEYVLRNITDGSGVEKLEKICKIMNFCFKNKAKVTEPVLNKNNAYVNKEKKSYLTKFYKGSSYDGKNSSLQDLAKNIALLHKVLSKVHIEYNYRTNQKYYKILSLNEYELIKDKIAKKKVMDRYDRIVLKNLKMLIDNSTKNKKFYKKLDNLGLKNQLIHHDIHPGNVIFYKNRVSAIIDFNSMRKGMKIRDVAFASFRFASYQRKNVKEIKEKIKLFLDVYKEYNSLEENSLKYFYYFLSNEILTRINYILRKKYFFHSKSWLDDLNKNLNLLQLASKI